MKKIVLSLLVLSLFLSLCGAGGVFADVGSQEAARSSVADKKTTKDSFLIGAWVSYYDYSISSYEEQTAFMADAGLNFNIFPHIWNTGEVDSTGTQFWQYVDETYRKNNMVYLIDGKYLFTGDTIWFGADGGYSFISALAEDNKLAVRSLAELEARLKKLGVKPLFITGHTGWTDNFDFAFAHKDRLCSPFGKRVHDPSAPYDAYDETDDTKEKAQAGRLKGIGR